MVTQHYAMSGCDNKVLILRIDDTILRIAEIPSSCYLLSFSFGFRNRVASRRSSNNNTIHTQHNDERRARAFEARTTFSLCKPSLTTPTESSRASLLHSSKASCEVCIKTISFKLARQSAQPLVSPRMSRDKVV